MDRSLASRTKTPLRAWPGPVLIATVAVVFRASYLIQIRRSPLFDYLHLDPLYYVTWGRRIAAGDWLGPQVFEQSPLYPYLLGLWFSLLGESGPELLWLRVLQLCLGAATCVGIFLVARELFDVRVALVSGLLAASYGPFLFYEGMVMKSFLTYVLATVTL